MNCRTGEKRTAFTSAAVAIVGRLPWQPYLLAINHLRRSDWDAVPTNAASHSAAVLSFGGTSHDCSGLNSNVHVAEVLTVRRYYGICIRNTVTSKVNPAICMDFLFRQLCRCITKVLCWQEQFLTIHLTLLAGLKHDLICSAPVSAQSCNFESNPYNGSNWTDLSEDLKVSVLVKYPHNYWLDCHEFDEWWLQDDSSQCVIMGSNCFLLYPHSTV